jgi:hypothetical protein
LLVIGNRLYSVLGGILQVAVGNGIKNTPVIEFATGADLLYPFLILLTGGQRLHILTIRFICNAVYILSPVPIEGTAVILMQKVYVPNSEVRGSTPFSVGIPSPHPI